MKDDTVDDMMLSFIRWVSFKYTWNQSWTQKICSNPITTVRSYVPVYTLDTESGVRIHGNPSNFCVDFGKFERIRVGQNVVLYWSKKSTVYGTPSTAICGRNGAGELDVCTGVHKSMKTLLENLADANR